MLTIALVSVCAVFVVCAALLHYYLPALIVGIAFGIVFCILGFAAGPEIFAPENSGPRRSNVTTRIGISLAAAGIAAGALDPARHFPDSFRVFYGVCLVIACIGALGLAVGKGAKAKK